MEERYESFHFHYFEIYRGFGGFGTYEIKIKLIIMKAMYMVRETSLLIRETSIGLKKVVPLIKRSIIHLCPIFL